MTLGAVALAETPLAGDVAADVRILNVAQTAPAATQSITADPSVDVQAAQTAPAATQSVSVSVTVTASLAQVAPAATQSATIPLTDLDLTVAQTAPAATQRVTIPLTYSLQPRHDNRPVKRRGRLGSMAGAG